MTAPMTPDEARLRELAEDVINGWSQSRVIYADEAKSILAILDALSAERERSAWKDIDTAPKDGTSILLVDAEDHPPLFSIGFWNDRTGGWDDGDFRDHMTGFTHWKPLTFEDADHG